MRRAVVAITGLTALFAGQPAEGGVTLRGRLFDGAASAEAITAARQRGERFDPTLKVPLGSKAIQVDLLGSREQGQPLATWNATSDDTGSFTLDTGRDAWPPGAQLVARGEHGGRRLFSAGLTPKGEEVLDFHLYPTTDESTWIQADMNVVYDVEAEGAQRRLRVRIRVTLSNAGGEMYIGRKTVSPARELWRVPLPEGAVITKNAGPTPDAPGWTQSADGRWLVIDSPVPGLLDFQLQGEHEVHYVMPPRQMLFQSYTTPVTVERQRVAFWCQKDAMKLVSQQLPVMNPTSLPDPFAGQGGQAEPGARTYDVHFRNEPLQAGQAVIVQLATDNVPLGQPINIGAFKWVGGFVLVCLIAVLGGLALGPRGAPPEAVLDGLRGEEVLDRIAALDARLARGEITERDHQRYREPLLELAAEELQAAGPRSASAPAEVALPPAVAEILDRLEALEKAGALDAARITERAHLLEALARVLRPGRNKA